MQRLCRRSPSERDVSERRLGYRRCVHFSEQLEGAAGVSVSVFNQETHANENASQLFSICFQRQILKADHAKRSHAHKEETLSVVVKIPTTIPMANPLPRYSHLVPQYMVVFVSAASFYFPLFLFICLRLCLGGSFQFRIWRWYSQPSAVPVPATPPPLAGVEGGAGGGGSAGILISQQKDFPPPGLEGWVKDRWLSAHVTEAEIS